MGALPFSSSFCSTGMRRARAPFGIPFGWRPAVVKPPEPTAQEPFRAAFCRAFNLPETAFEGWTLRRCFPWWSRPLGMLVLLVKPGVFHREIRTLGQLGRATHPAQFGAEFEAYVYESARDKVGFRTRTLGLRLSRRRFERLAVEVRRRTRGSRPWPTVGTAGTGLPGVRAGDAEGGVGSLATSAGLAGGGVGDHPGTAG